MHTYTISADTANAAYAAALASLRHHTEEAKVIRRITAELSDTFLTCKIVDKLQTMYPNYRIYYYKDYSGAKDITLTQTDAPEGVTPLKLDIRLAKPGEKRVSAETLAAQLKYSDSTAEVLTAALETFYDLLPQYNTLIQCVNSVYNQIQPILYRLPNYRGY